MWSLFVLYLSGWLRSMSDNEKIKDDSMPAMHIVMSYLCCIFFLFKLCRLNIPHITIYEMKHRFLVFSLIGGIINKFLFFYVGIIKFIWLTCGLIWSWDLALNVNNISTLSVPFFFSFLELVLLKFKEFLFNGKTYIFSENIVLQFISW